MQFEYPPRRLLRGVPLSRLALAGAVLVTGVIAGAAWIVSLGPLPIEAVAERSVIVTDRNDRLLRAYATYVTSLGATHGAHERREARNAARVARANAEAALARLLAEPATPDSPAELAQSLLSNSNRLARTAMTLDAARNTPPLRPWESLQPLLVQGAGTLEEIATAVAKNAAPTCISPQLRATQRDLARKLSAAGDGGIDAELATLSDRLADNINTLAHVVARARATAT